MKSSGNLILIIIFILYGCNQNPNALDASPIFETINQLTNNNWKDEKIKSSELQKILGVEFYNSLPIKKDSIRYRFNKINDVIHHVGYYIGEDYIELNDYVYSNHVELYYTQTNKLENLIFQYYEHNSKDRYRDLKVETTLEGDRIKVFIFNQESIDFNLYNLDGVLLIEGLFKERPLNSMDSIINYNPFRYEEKIKLKKWERVKFGRWKYFDKTGTLIKEEYFD